MGSVTPIAASPRRSQEERRRTTRAAILEATINRVCRLGASGAVMNDIAAEAGLTKGALQHHFADKSDLMATIVETGWGELVDTLRGISSIEGSVDERIDTVVERMWSAYMIPAIGAAVVIHLSAPRDERLAGRNGHLLRSTQDVLDAEWRRLFSGSGAPPESIHAARRLARSTLGGMLYQSEMEPGVYDADEDLAVLKQVVRTMLKSDAG